MKMSGMFCLYANRPIEYSYEERQCRFSTMERDGGGSRYQAKA